MARDTVFYLYKDVNLSPSTGDTFYFANRTAQNTFFSSKLYQTITACSYQRENRNYIKVNLGIASCFDIDYLCFLNTSYEQKKFYAFVNEVNYISDNCTEIGYEIDVVQTWLLDCTVQPCFIERQHTATDGIGDNLIEESLELGDYLISSMVDGITTQSGRDMDLLVIFQTTFDMQQWSLSHWNTKAPVPIRTRDGLIDGLGLYACYVRYEGVQNTDSGSALAVLLEKIFRGTGGGVTIEDVVNIYVYPRMAVDIGNPLTDGILVDDTTSSVGILCRLYEINGVANVGGYKGAFCQLPSRPSSLNGYTPKNKKLLTYPYCLLHITNNNGSAIDIKYERFSDPTDPTATVFGTTTAEGKVRLVPRNYYGSGNYDSVDTSYGLDSAPFPTVALTGDSYNIWLAQNRNTIENKYNELMYKEIGRTANQSIKSMLEGYGGIGTMGVFAMNEVLNARIQANQMLAEYKDRQIAPNTAVGIQSEGLGFQNGKAPFTFIVKTIDSYHAKMIDDFFTMYGYPIKQIGTPNFHTRTAFTYVKTIGCVLHGSAPEKDKQTLAKMIDNGLRFWANQNSIGDYTVTNSVLT